MNEPIAFFGSQFCPGDIILKAHDWAKARGLERALVIGGFHTPVERDVLRSSTPVTISLVRTAQGWRASNLAPSAMDKLLHRNRVDGRSKKQITFEAPLSELPSGVFFALSDGGGPILRRDNGYSAWSFEGYEDVDCNPNQLVTVLTPMPIVEAIKSGYEIL